MILHYLKIAWRNLLKYRTQSVVSILGLAVGFASYRELQPDELFGVLKNIELANGVRRKTSKEVLLITGIYSQKENPRDGDAIHDAAQLLLVEVIARALRKNGSFALFVSDRNLASEEAVSALERQGFVRPPISEDSDRRILYAVDMHEPLLLLHNLETTIKEPFASCPEVQEMMEKNHQRLQLAMTKLYPGNLVLSLSSSVMHHRLVDRITALNEVPSEPTVPRRLGVNMCVPFGKILRGKVVPNTVTKTLHTDKVYEPDLDSYSIEPFPYYSPLKSQIATIRSFDRPVILVDDLVHKADRLQATGRPVKMFNRMVLIGHSMGGLLSKTLIMNAENRLVEPLLGDNYREMLASLTAEQRDFVTRMMDFKALPFVQRVVFIAVPHRGSEMANSAIGRIGASLIELPQSLVQRGEGVIGNLMRHGWLQPDNSKIQTGIDNLDPNNRTLQLLETIPFRPGVPYHSVIGNRKEAGIPGGSDGIVPYASSHLDGAVSELVVKSDHSAQQNPLAIREIRRILLEHLRQYPDIQVATPELPEELGEGAAEHAN